MDDCLLTEKHLGIHIFDRYESEAEDFVTIMCFMLKKMHVLRTYL